MKSTLTPHIATAVTTEDLVVNFGPSGGRTVHTVSVPAGTRCTKLKGGSEPWVVDDLSFIADRRGLLYSDADHYGIQIPPEKLTHIQAVPA